MKDGFIEREEEESLVAAVVEVRQNHGPAKGAAEIVEFQPPVRNNVAGGVHGGERIARVQSAVADVLVGAAVKAIGSGLQHHVKHAAARAAVFCCQVAGDRLEFRNGIRGGIDVDVLGQGRDIQIPVEIPRVRAALSPVHGNVRALHVGRVGKSSELAVEAEIARRGSGHVLNPRQHVDQLLEVASRQGHLFDDLCIHRAGGVRRSGLNQRHFRRNIHQGARCSHLYHGVHPSLLAGGHPDFRDIERREAGVLEAYVVPSRHQIDRTVVTRVISLGGRSDVRLTRSNSDLDARYGCATRIRHRAFDHATVDLRINERRADDCPHKP